MPPAHEPFLLPVLIFCAAAVVAVPLFRFFGLSAVLGYLAAGVVIGPDATGLIRDTSVVAQVSELGVVLLLFLVGLELRIGQIWSMRRDIFGLGLAQLSATALVFGTAAAGLGLPPIGAVVVGL